MITFTVLMQTIYTVLTNIINGFFLMILWEAIAPYCNLPTFSFWVYVAAMWVINELLTSLRPKAEIKCQDDEQKRKK